MVLELLSAYWLYITVAIFVLWVIVRSQYKPPLYLDDSVVQKALQQRYPKYDIPKNCLVTGGCGFLGRHVVDALLMNGNKVTVFDIVKRFDHPDVTFIVGDLTKKDEVLAATRDIDVVFHVASPPTTITNRKLFYDVNVTGTDNLLKSCEENGVQRLVFTSSASVVYDGTDQINVDEQHGYPATPRDAYCETKILAEKLVLEAGASKSRLITASVRPHGIFGPRDPLLVPTLVETCKKGKSKFAIGSGATKADFTYVGNVVHGHMLAAQALVPGSQVNGQTYFITNDEPVVFWGFLASVLVALGYPAPKYRLPYRFILGLSYIASGIASVVAPKAKLTFTPSRIQIAGTAHYYSCEKAKRELNYKPLWSVAEGLAMVSRRFKHLRNPAVPSLPQDDPVKFTTAEVRLHCSKDDAWLLIDGKVYDVTEYVEYHPGNDAILRKVGEDSTEGFNGPQHPQHARDALEKYCIGWVDQ